MFVYQTNSLHINVRKPFLCVRCVLSSKKAVPGDGRSAVCVPRGGDAGAAGERGASCPGIPGHGSAPVFTGTGTSTTRHPLNIYEDINSTRAQQNRTAALQLGLGQRQVPAPAAARRCRQARCVGPR